MHNIDNKVFTIQISNILSSIVKEQSTYSNHLSANIISLYDSIFYDNFFIISIQNRILLKGKINHSNGSFIIQHCPNKSILSGQIIKTIKLNCLNTIIQNNSDDIYLMDISKIVKESLFEQIRFDSNNITKITGVIEKKKIKKISLGSKHVLYLSYGGMIYAQGDNSKSQLGIENIDESDDQMLLTSLLNYFITDIASGENHNFACGKRRHNSNCTNNQQDNKEKSKETNDLEINSNENSVLFSWGDNSNGQCGFEALKSKTIQVPSIILYSCNISQISLGLNHSLVLMSNGDVVACGNNQYSKCVNLQYEYIDSLIQSTYPFLQSNNEHITSIKSSPNSSLLITDKGTLILKGKIVNGTQTAFKLIEGLNISSIEITFSDEHCLIVHPCIEHNNIIIKLNTTTTNNSIEEKTSEYNTLFQRDIIIPMKSDREKDDYQYEEMFDDLLSEDNDTFKYNSSESTDNSLYELRSYINLLGISLSPNYNSEMSFRPQNLPPKTKEEEILHKKLVEQNRQLNMNVNKHKQQLEKEHQKLVYEKNESNEKRTQYWLKEIIPHWTLMKSNKNFTLYFYEGIPSAIRGQVWLLSVGNKFSITRDFYNIEVKKSIQLLLKEKTKQDKEKDMISSKDDSRNKDKEQDKDKYKLIGLSDSDIYNRYIIKTTNKEKTISLIDLDVERTFAYLGVFKAPSPLCDALREILRAFVVSRPDIGYVQGLSYIAATLLLQMDKYQSFVCLINITLSPSILPFYLLDEKNIKIRIELFNEIFICNLPKLHQHFSDLDIISEHFMIEWFMTLFTRNLHIDLAVRIWDVYMIDGIATLYKASIVILQYFERQYLAMDFDDILHSLKTLEELKLSEDIFIDSMRNVKLTDKIIQKVHRINEDFITFE